MVSIVRNTVINANDLLFLSYASCWSFRSRIPSLSLFFKKNFCEKKSEINEKVLNNVEIKNDLCSDHHIKFPQRSLSVEDQVNKLIQQDYSENEADHLKLFSNKISGHLEPDLNKNGNKDSSKFLKEFSSREKALQPGEFVIIDHQEGKRAYFTKMFKLNMNSKINTPYGRLDNQEIIGCLSGKRFKTSKKNELLVRRVSLYEYVLNMRHKANIALPETAQWMLMIVDASPGDVILEAGTGSGSLALFLSKCVGSDGHVISLEIREDHLDISKENCKNWRESFNKSHELDWPDNISFHLADVYDEKNVSDILGNCLLDAVCLDLLNTLPALSVVVPRLKHGKCISIYYPHLTQIIDLYDYIEKNSLPLQVEGVYEIMPREWIIKPVSTDYEEMESPSTSDNDGDHISTSYMCKPEISSSGYAAFLVKVRKVGVKMS